jgi:hypothetical protein
MCHDDILEKVLNVVYVVYVFRAVFARLLTSLLTEGASEIRNQSTNFKLLSTPGIYLTESIPFENQFRGGVDSRERGGSIRERSRFQL